MFLKVTYYYFNSHILTDLTVNTFEKIIFKVQINVS